MTPSPPHPLTPSPRHALHRELSGFLDRARAPRLRTMRRFAEQEIIIPAGPYAGRRFRCNRQPYTALWFDLVDSGRWSRFAAVGPTQSGKTLAAFCTPALYHLFEWGENVVCGVPNLEMAADKWKLDLLPVIQRTRYRGLLPTTGDGARGGKVRSVQFRNGATLRFMTGGSRDKGRAGFTSRVLVVTEADDLDEPGTTSRETDKLKQLEARLRAYGDQKRVYLECTASIEEGRIWQEYQAGTRTAIRLRCPLCKAWVSPEREHLVGWQDAEDELAAGDAARFSCPDCGKPWTDKHRRKANLRARPLHRGQELTPAGKVTGQPPRTKTLGFRWSAVNNFFATAADIGADEWKAARAVDEDSADREMRQFVWAVPAVPPEIDETPLDTRTLVNRRDRWPRGVLPPDTERLTVGVDLGKRVGWYLVLALRKGRGLHVVDYGSFDIQSDDLDLAVAMLKSLRDFRDTVQAGWMQEGQAEPRVPDQVWIDAGYQPEVVHTFVRESARGQALHNRYRAILGRGAGQRAGASYSRPGRTSRTIRRIGNGWHLARLDRPGSYHVILDADLWKTWIHHRLSTPTDEPGALVFYASPDPHEHTKLSKHLTSERQVTEYLPRRGLITRWQRISRTNHWLDCATYAAAAGDSLGWRLVDRDRGGEGRGARGEGTPPETASADPDRPPKTSWFAQQRKNRGRRR